MQDISNAHLLTKIVKDSVVVLNASHVTLQALESDRQDHLTGLAHDSILRSQELHS